MRSGDTIEDLLLFLLKYDSLTGQEQEICDAIRNYYRAAPAKVIADQLTTAYLFSSVPDKPTISFYGHIDTVTNQQSLPPCQKNGKIYGCGASDMKGGLAIMMRVMNELSTGREAKFNTQFIFYDAEEGPGDQNGLNHFLPKHIDSLNCDLSLVMEPTNNEIQKGCVGSLHVGVIVEGSSAHSARPWEGINAIQKSWQLLKLLDDQSPLKVTIDGLDFYEVLNVTQASGGQTRNSVPGSFELNLNYRFAPDKNEEQAFENVKSIVGELGTVKLTDSSPSGKVMGNNQWLDQLVQAGNLECRPKQAWTDVARLSSFGIPAVNFGPGDTAQAHQADEHILVPAMWRSWELLESFLFEN